jgi:hypothetical protein
MSVSKIVREELENLLSVFSKDFISEQIDKHTGKIHAVSVEYRVRGAIHQSLNIKFGSSIESMLSRIIDASGHLKLHAFSGKRIDLPVATKKVKLIDDYVNNRPKSVKTVNADFGNLKNALKRKAPISDTKRMDVDLLFQTRGGKLYYVEVKYNDDHDTGKYPDIYRKALKTGISLELETKKPVETFVYYFNSGERNLVKYFPNSNQLYGKDFFTKFKLGSYQQVCSEISKYQKIIDMKFKRLTVGGKSWMK